MKTIYKVCKHSDSIEYIFGFYESIEEASNKYNELYGVVGGIEIEIVSA